MRHLVFLAVLICATDVLAQQRGVPLNGYPDWQERVILVYTNRARADPQADLAGCPSTDCLEAACYTTKRPPLTYDYNLSRSARFHSANLRLTGCFQHPSPCQLVSNISSLWDPNGTCNGSATCACQGGTFTCNTTTGTDPFARMDLFSGTNGNGENIAYRSPNPNPKTIFYDWFWEPAASSACVSTQENGHRWNILSGSFQTLGAGHSITHYTQDFGQGGAPTGTLIAGVHEPQTVPTTATNVEFRVNYYDTRGAPIAAQINIDGTCSSMSLERGTANNATYLATVSVNGSACHHYVFSFRDPSGATVLLPETGSYGIGNSLTSCPDYATAAVASCGGGVNTPPQITTAAAANPDPVSGKTTTLTVGAIDDTGEAQLTYAWTQTAGPTGVTFSANNTHAASSTVATFPSDGTFTLKVVATDPMGLSAQSSVSVTVNRTPTTVVVTPSAVTIVPSGTQQFTASVVDQFNQPFVSPTLLWTTNGGGTVDNAGLYTAASTTGGPFTVTATSGAASGNAYVTVSNGPADTQPPQVFITGPTAGTTVTGTLTVSASAIDNVGVAKVIFLVDGAQIGESSTIPYQTTWNADASGPGVHELRARGVDYSGNAADAVITVTVPGAVGNDGGSGGGAGGGSGGGETVAPTVRILSPNDGATLSGEAKISAEASDNVGVVQVEFRLDGNPFATATSEPWEVTLDTSDVKDGPHDLIAVAIDAAGNQGLSLPVRVTTAGSTGGCHCSSADGAVMMLPLLAFVRRRRRGRSRPDSV